MSGEARLPLSKARILDVALRIADEGGVESLSMRNIASHLGVKAMSLYNHVEGKEEILDGIVERVVGEIDIPSPEDHWRTAMRKRALSAHDVLRRHPWATLTLLSRANAGPAMLRYVEATLACLRAAGFSNEMADHVWNAMDSYIYGFTLQMLKFPFEAEEFADTAKEYMARIPTAEYPHFAALAATIVDGSYTGLHTLEFGLKLILDGLERYAPSD